MLWRTCDDATTANGSCQNDSNKSTRRVKIDPHPSIYREHRVHDAPLGDRDVRAFERLDLDERVDAGRKRLDAACLASAGALLLAVVDVLVQEHQGAERVGECRLYPCGDGCFSAPHGCRGSRALVFLARSLVAVLWFSCAHRQLAPRGGSRGGVKGEAATALTMICQEAMGGWGAATNRSRGAWWRFPPRCPRASAPSRTTRSGSWVTRLLGMDVGRADRAVSVSVIGLL